MKIATISNDGALAVQFAWADGKKSVFRSQEIKSQEIATAERLLGRATKLQNAYAGAVSKGLTVADCRKATEALWARLVGGDWAAAPSGGIWCEAIARAMGKPLADVVVAWNGMDDAKKSAVRKHPKVAAAKLAIETERLSDAEEGGDDVLAEFGEVTSEE